MEPELIWPKICINLSSIIRKSIEQRQMLHQDCQSFGLIVKTLEPQVHTILKYARFLLITSKDMAQFKFLLM